MASVEPSDSPLVLFDGACRLCNASVRWIIQRDRRSLFRFASLQSQAARFAIAAASPNLRPDSLPDSIVLIDGLKLYTRSDAALRIAQRLGLPWSIATAAKLLPRTVRDSLYNWIARNRYGWFGKQESCAVLTPKLRARFLDADESCAAPGAVVEGTTDEAHRAAPS